MVSDQSQNSGLSTRLPNYVNPTTRGPAVQVTSILFAVLVTMSLALRLYTRGRIKRQFQVDDIFATFATLLADATFVIQIVLNVVFHQDRHRWDIPPGDQYAIDRMAFVYNIVFAEAACQSKLSLLLFTLKMIGAARQGAFRSHYISLLTLIVIVALCQILFVVVSCVECHPLKAAWDANPTYPYKCFNTDIFLFACGIINTLTDFLCTVMPAFIILKLHMPFRKRMGVASLFFIGIIVNVASALRIYFLANEVETGSDTWNTLPPAVCSNLELGLGLLCVNFPSIRPLVSQFSKHAISYVRSSVSNSKQYTSNTNNTKPNYPKGAGDTFWRSSSMFIPVGDGFMSAASASASVPRNHDRPSQHAWRKKNSVDSDAIEVLHTVELNSDTASGPRHEEQNQSDQLSLQR